jgi:hypothetical protein
MFVFSFALLMVGSEIGDWFRKRSRPFKDSEREDYTTVVSATLTLLGLLIGFSFSMAVSRYDQRKNYEEAEANAIGTEYVRADLLPAQDAAKVRGLLKKYTEERILFYKARRGDLAKINADTADLQNQLWAAITGPATAQPNPVMALVASGMNDVLNSQGYTQAAWWNRIPTAAWVLMLLIAFCCNGLIAFGARETDRKVFVILPIAVSIAFFLIADIDSPRHGAIPVAPQNLTALYDSLRNP